MGHNRGVMFDRLRAKRAERRDQAKTADATDLALSEFVASRPGVQAWVEEATGFNRASVLLVAGSGEWIRRPVIDTDWGRDFAVDHGLTCYTAGVDPYPQRMRDWDAAHRKAASDDR